MVAIDDSGQGDPNEPDTPTSDSDAAENGSALPLAAHRAAEEGIAGAIAAAAAAVMSAQQIAERAVTEAVAAMANVLPDADPRATAPDPAEGKAS
jgi:hypothetical protein